MRYGDLRGMYLCVDLAWEEEGMRNGKWEMACMSKSMNDVYK